MQIRACRFIAPRSPDQQKTIRLDGAGQRERPFFGLVRIVAEVITGETDGHIGGVVQFNPVLVFIVIVGKLIEVGTGIFIDHNLRRNGVDQNKRNEGSK